METIKTPCGHEFDEEICPVRHKTQVEFKKLGRRVDVPGCITCPHFVTKSADKPETPAIEPETKQEEPETMQPEPTPAPALKKAKPAKPVLTCSICGNPRGKNPSGLCRLCSARQNAKNARAAKPKNPAPKTGAKKPLPNLPASQLCKEYQIQNCHDCDDLTCGDNLQKPATDAIHAAKLPGPEEYSLANPPKRAQLLSLHTTLTEQARELMTRKNADYGANADPFANFRMSALLHIQPEFGVLLRMQDKMARLVSFLEKGELAVKEESWSDAIIDIINYSVLLCGLLQERAGK